MIQSEALALIWRIINQMIQKKELNKFMGNKTTDIH